MAMDFDTVTGGPNYIHTMSQANATIAKKSWSIYHDDGKSNYRIFTGFVLNTLKITIDKTLNVITVDVTGMAWKETDTTSKTTNKASNYNIYSPGTAKLELGVTQVDNFNSIVIDILCNTRVFQGINDTRYPANVDGQDLLITATLEGEWNEASGQVSDTLRTAYLTPSTMTDNLIISFGSSSTNDYCIITFRRWELETQSAKNIEIGTPLPQSLVAYPVHQGDITNNYWDVVIKNTVAANAGSL